MIALLGRRDIPTDGVDDYCTFLGEALTRRGVELKKARVEWREQGWVRSFLGLWREAASWRGQWVILQFTSLAWSRRGFPFAALVAVAIVRSRGGRAAVFYHEPYGYDGTRLIDRLRRNCQEWVLRQLYRFSEKPIFADPLGKISWLPAGVSKAVSIPIGASVPEPSPMPDRFNGQNGNRKTIAVYCVGDPPHRGFELEDISAAIAPLAANGSKMQLVFLGRGSPEAQADIERVFRSIPVEVRNLGIVSAAQVSRVLSESHAMLCVRGRLFPRRSSALAGIACGVPMVAYAGAAEGTPLAAAGVELVPYRDAAALGRSLGHILEDREFWETLHCRSREAHRRYFCWEAIAENFVSALGLKGT
jgi:glycosyltransferase involved in cell wall biosynthesis